MCPLLGPRPIILKLKGLLARRTRRQRGKCCRAMHRFVSGTQRFFSAAACPNSGDSQNTVQPKLA